MSMFRYRAYDAKGKAFSDVIDADNRKEAQSVLAAQGRTVFELAELKSPAKATARFRTNAKVARAGGSLSKKELASLLADIASLLEAGFNMDLALDVCSQSSSRKVSAALSNVRATLAEGKGLAEGFDRHLDLSAIDRTVIEVAERVGDAAGAFRRLANYHTARIKVQSEVISTVSYPAFLMVVFVLVVILLSVQMVPAMEPIFATSDTPIPLLMSLLGSLGSALRSSFPFFAISALLGCLALLSRSLRSALLSSASTVLRKVPGLGAHQRRMLALRYLSALSSLVTAKVPLTQALDLAARASRHRQDAALLGRVSTFVAEGGSVANGLSETGLIEDHIVSLVDLGTQSNTLSPMLERAVVVLTDKTTASRDRFLSFLSPAITIALGLLIGTLVISVMSALLSINDVAIG